MAITGFGSKFRSEQNALYTKGMFIEYYPDAMYTLQNVDIKGAKSLYLIYMAMEDQTEFEFARATLEGWEHWTRLCEAEWFKPFIARWRQELELLHTARAMRHIKLLAEEPGRHQLSANKILIDLQKPRSGVGRPTQARIKEEAAKLQSASDDVNRDFLRLSEASVLKALETVN